MLLKAIRYVTLFLIMLNFPGWVLTEISPVLSSLLSELSFGLMILYFLLARQWSFNGWMLLLGCFYFGISSLSDQTYIPDTLNFIIIIVKYFILIIGGYAIVIDTTESRIVFLFVNRCLYGIYTNFPLL